MSRGRGGPRTGTQGTKYPNRSDLRGGNGTIPISAVPGQQYGMAGAQKAAQAIVPMGTTPTPPMGATPSAPSTFPVGTGPAPGSVADIFAPSQRPDEHLMTGVGDPSMLAPTMPVSPAAKALALLNSLGDNVSAYVADIRHHLVLQAQNQMPQ